MKIIAICGPTGVGKTTLSIQLAKALHAEIISCDSMQFYRGLDIGTAKVTKAEMAGVRHHLLDILEPEASFSVAEYQRIVREKIDALIKRNITPILVGGSGLFIKSVLYDYKFKGNERNTDTETIYKNYSLEDLVEILNKKAPELATHVDLTNRRRVLRAIEKTDEDLDLSGEQLYYPNTIIIGLKMDRLTLYERIDQRVDMMMKQGLLKEAKYVYDLQLETQASKAIGYKEFFGYFNNEMDLDTSIELLKRNSRRYAKRQMTWFRNKMECIWIDVDIHDFNKTIEAAKNIIKKETNE